MAEMQFLIDRPGLNFAVTDYYFFYIVI